jgi:prepilin-type processing-associated H-X9-DG protein
MCINNLKQISLGYIAWADDHGGEFPAQVPLADKGAMEFASSGYASLQFRALSEYVRFPQVFVCPADKLIQVAENCNNLRDENTSYFINVDATTNDSAQTILAGDRNLEANGQPVKPELFEITANLDMSWTREIHSKGGNLAFADGHVEWVWTNNLNPMVQHQPLATNRPCVP